MHTHRPCTYAHINHAQAHASCHSRDDGESEPFLPSTPFTSAMPVMAQSTLIFPFRFTAKSFKALQPNKTKTKQIQLQQTKKVLKIKPFPHPSNKTHIHTHPHTQHTSAPQSHSNSSPSAICGRAGPPLSPPPSPSDPGQWPSRPLTRCNDHLG